MQSLEGSWRKLLGVYASIYPRSIEARIGESLISIVVVYVYSSQYFGDPLLKNVPMYGMGTYSFAFLRCRMYRQ